MPFYNLAIEEIDEAIIRPNIVSIVKDVLGKMELPSNIKIMYRGRAAQYFYDGSTYDERKYLDGHNRYSGDMLLYIETTVEDNEDRLINSQVHAVNERPIFGDYSIDAFMKPAYVSKKVTINFKLTGTEKEVERWRANIRRSTTQDVVNLIHSVKYHYPIPSYFMYLLVTIYNLKKNVAPIPETLVEYFKKCFIKPITVVTSDNGNGPLYTVMESQSPVVGWFEFGFNPPKPEKEGEVGLYSLDFDYSLIFDCPETISMYCPIAIHNQLLPPEFLADLKIPTIVDEIYSHGSISNEALRALTYESSTDRKLRTHPGLPIPSFDDWLGDRDKIEGYTHLVRALIHVDVSDRQKLLNLKTMSKSWSFNPIFLEYLKKSRKWLTVPYMSLFNIRIYRWNNLLDNTHIEVDEDLNVYYRRGALSLTDNYHVVISFLHNVPLLDDRAWKDITDFPCMFKQLVHLYTPDVLAKYDLSLDNCLMNPLDPSPGKDGSGNDPIVNPPGVWPPPFGGDNGGWKPGDYDPETGLPIPTNPHNPEKPTHEGDGNDDDIIKDIIDDMNKEIVDFRRLEKPEVLWRLVCLYSLVTKNLKDKVE